MFATHNMKAVEKPDFVPIRFKNAYARNGKHE